MSNRNDDLKMVRLRVPEPTWVDNPVIKFMWTHQPFFWDDSATIETGELHLKQFYEDGVLYSAWTYDGKTPLFPVPI